MDVSLALTRAASMLGKRTKYHLGRGGTNPAAPTPADKARECDCSGFICWCLGMSRRTKDALYRKMNGGWINTTAIVYDVNHAGGFFSKLAAPAPGALWVYGWAGKNPGHVGIIESVTKSGTTIIHCSAGNYRSTGDAIRRTPGRLFEKNPRAVLAWYDGYTPQAAAQTHELIDELFLP